MKVKFSEHNLVVLISTMNQQDKNLIETMNISSDAIVINQIEKNEVYKNSNTYWINTDTRGLSVSRNLALETAKNMGYKIGIIADDDLIYDDNYNEKIIQAYNENPTADIIVFQIIYNGKLFKNYSSKKKKINFFSSMRVSSVEITFKVDSIVENNIKFDNLFGSGSIFTRGEENIFLRDCLKKKLKILYIPSVISNLQDSESSWFTGFNEKYFYDLGAIYARIQKRGSIFLIFQFIIRKRNLYKKELSSMAAFKHAIEGRRYYLDKYR